jgi:DNA invertase Pin-like site-specific DNA recombinase
VVQRRYIAYYRVSTQRQGRSGLGLEGQQIAVRRFLESNAGELIADFSEIESGRKADRPKLLEALRLCRVYSATLLIARLDRLSRNVALISKLMESGVEFVAADFPQANHFTVHVLAAVAEYELKIMSDRAKAAFAAAKARGTKTVKYPKGFHAHRPEALALARAAQTKRSKERATAIAPLLRELRESGKSLHGIAAELTRMEIETPRCGIKWSREAVRRLFLWCGEELPSARLNGRIGPKSSTISSVREGAGLG